MASDDQKQQRSITFKAKNYCLEGGQLYRRSLTEPLLKCVGKEEAEIAMLEVHSGICGEHLAGKNLALKLMRYGIFWPTMRKYCEEYTKKCKPCQLYNTMNHKSSTSFSSVTSPSPFFIWGIDLVSPLPKGPGQKKFIIVAICYYTKWVEAKPLARIREIEVIEFFMGFFIFRFDVPWIVVTDNGLQFVSIDFEKVLSNLKIQHSKASVAYPQSNGQVEITKKAILQGIKKRLAEANRN